MDIEKIIDYKSFKKLIKNNENAINIYIICRFDNNIKCVHCNNDKNIYKKKENIKLYYCNNCKNSFSIFKNSFMEKSETDIIIWYYGIYCYYNKKLITITKFANETNITYKTAWRIKKIIESKKNDKSIQNLYKYLSNNIG